MRYCVQFENHAIEIALIRVKVMSEKSKGEAREFFTHYSRGLTQFPWRDFQTERKNITFKTLKI